MDQQEPPADGTVRPGAASYQRDYETTANLLEQITTAIDRNPRDRLRAFMNIYKSSRAGRVDKTVFSFADIPPREFGSRRRPLVDPVIGSLIFNGDLEGSALGSFFDRDRRFPREDGSFELRGANYFVSLDERRKSPAEKLDVMERDFQEGLQLLESAGVPRNREEFLMQLGILDYLKIHSLSMLHAVTYDERKARIPQNPQEHDAYMQIRRESIDLVSEVVRRFYQTAFELPFDRTQWTGVKERMEKVANYLRGSLGEGDYYKLVTYPDVNNPLVILLGAHEAAVQNRNIDTIVGLASGGTESAIATQLFFSFIYGESPDLAILPISFHSGRIKNPHRKVDAWIRMFREIYPREFNERKVLLVDDNSNTGSTLQAADSIVRGLDASLTQAHIAEHDPARMQFITRQRKADGSHRRAFDVEHPGRGTTMGIASIDESTYYDNARLMIRERLNTYHNQTPN